VFGATVLEKREGRDLNPPQQQQTGAYTTMYSTYDNALAALERQGGLGGPGGYLPQPSYSPYSLPPPPPSASYGLPPQPQYAMQPQGYGQQQPQQYSAAGAGGSTFSDPGFSMQTGFEGFLVPNPWYGLLPWGLEGGVVIAIAVIVFIIVKIALIFLFLKIFKIGRLFKDEEDDGEVRSYLPSYLSRQNLANVASAVFDAIDRYNEIEQKED